LHWQAAMPKDSKHRLIFRENIRLKPRYPSLSSDSHEMSQDESRDATAPVVAVGGKGELGTNRAHTLHA
jgi:hypothetical protein